MTKRHQMIENQCLIIIEMNYKNNLNFFLVSGSKEARLRKSILKIDKFISQ